MLLLPVFSVIYKRAFYFFPVLIIGSIPYVTAFSLLMIMLLQLNIFFKKQNTHIVVIGLIWVLYGLLLAIFRIDAYFINEIIQLGICLMASCFLYNSIRDSAELKKFLIFLISSAFLLAALEFLIDFFGFQISTTSLVDSKATNYTSIYMILAVLPFGLVYFKSIFTKIFLLLICLEIASLNQGRAMYLISLALFAVYLLRNRSPFFNLVFLSISAILLFSFISIYGEDLLYVNDSIFSLLNTSTNFSNLERLSLLSYSYELFIENPFGHGIGSSAEIFRGNLVTINDHYPHPHNTLAFFAVELGVVGIFLYLYLFGALFYSSFSIKKGKYRTLAFLLSLALFLISIASTIFYNGVITILSFIIISIIFLTKKVAINDQGYK